MDLCDVASYTTYVLYEFDCRMEAEVPRDGCLLPSRTRALHQGPRGRRGHDQGVDCVGTIYDESKVVDPPVRRFSGEELEDLSCRPSVPSSPCGPRRESTTNLVYQERMTQIVFETLNVPAMYVTNQADSSLYAASAPPTM